MTTFLSIAENSRLEFKSFTCNSSGKLEQADGKLQMTEVMIEPVLTILNEQDREKAIRILTKTEAACLITNSIKSKVSMKPIVENCLRSSHATLNISQMIPSAYNLLNDKPKKPSEIPVPGKNPDTIPAEEPEPGVWPKKEPEIQPEREPLTIPPTAPPEIPQRPEV